MKGEFLYLNVQWYFGLAGGDLKCVYDHSRLLEERFSLYYRITFHFQAFPGERLLP